MAFTVRTINRAPLTRVREQAILTHVLPTGILSGLQAYDGAGGFQVNLTAGKCIINGIVIEEDASQSPVFTLPSPTNDEHHIIYMRFDPENDEAPTYVLESGRYDPPNNGATIGFTDPTDIGHSVILAEIFVPSTASTIADCAIVNPDVFEPMNEYHGVHKNLVMRRATVLESGGTYTMHFEDANMLVWSQNKDWYNSPDLRPMYSAILQTATNSTLPGWTSGIDYEISHTPDVNDDVIVFYARDATDYSFRAGALDVYSVSFGAISPAVDPGIAEIRELFGNAGAGAPGAEFPDRQDDKNIFILAVINLESVNADGEAVHFANGVSMRVGDEYRDGRLQAYVSEITSTAYGTTGVITDGALDLDTVIDNAAALHNATLDTAYDGFELGASPGDGRTITVDAGAVELNNTASDVAPADKWNAAMRFNLDAADANNAVSHERAVDVWSNDQDSERIALVNRRPLYDSINASLMSDISIDTSPYGNAIKITIAGLTADEWMELHNNNLAYAQSRWVSFSSVVGNASDKTYRILVDQVGGELYLQTSDGVDQIVSVYSGDFNPDTQTTTGTIWEIHNKIAQDSVLQDLEIQGTVSGAGGDVLTGKFAFSGYEDLQSVVEDLSDDQPNPYHPAAAMLNCRPYALGSERTFPGVAVNPQSVPSRGYWTDGRYRYVVESFSFAQIPIKVYDAREGLVVTTLTTLDSDIGGTNVAIAANGNEVVVAYQDLSNNPRTELIDIETGNNLWFQESDVTGTISDTLIFQDRVFQQYQNTSSDQMFVMRDASDGSIATDSTAANLNMAHRASAGRGMSAWGNKLALLTDDGAGDAQLAVLYVQPGLPYVDVVFEGNLQPLYGAIQPYGVAVTEKYIFVVAEDAVNDPTIYRMSVRPDGSFSLVDSSTITSSPITQFRITGAKDYVVMTYVDAGATIVAVYSQDDGANPIYQTSTPTASQSVIAVDTDLNDYHLLDTAGNTLSVYSLGRPPQIWSRYQNRTDRQFNTHGFSPSLAIPSK